MPTRVRELEARLIQARTAAECLAALLELAEVHAAMNRNREGLRCAREALNIARARADSVSAARALCAAARCHNQRGDPVAAAASGFDAIQAFGRDDFAGRSAALRQLAAALLAVESLELAEGIAQRAAQDADQSGDFAAQACARTVWGLVLARGNRHEEARRRFREAGALLRGLNDPARLRRVTFFIGRGYLAQANEAMRQAEPARARILWRQATRVLRVAMGAEVSAADDALVRAALAECECRLEEPARALRHLGPVLALEAGTLSPEAVASCHLWESHALRALGEVDAARRAAERARAAAEQLGSDPLLAACLRAESALCDLSGRFETAQDLETRAERVELERLAGFATVRRDLDLLLARQPEGMPAFLRAVA